MYTCEFFCRWSARDPHITAGVKKRGGQKLVAEIGRVGVQRQYVLIGGSQGSF